MNTPVWQWSSQRCDRFRSPLRRISQRRSIQYANNANKAVSSSDRFLCHFAAMYALDGRMYEIGGYRQQSLRFGHKYGIERANGRTGPTARTAWRADGRAPYGRTG